MKRLAWHMACAALLCLGSVQTGIARDDVISTEKGDPEMEAAYEKARATLSEFWAMADNPQPGTSMLALKVGISDPKQDFVEFFWLTEVRRLGGGRLSGVISNEPSDVKTVRQGQRYAFAEKEIVDWTFMRNGKIVGNWTLRPLLRRMPKAQAEHYQRMLEQP
jgi:uncharacterized protein YegJ (DUF2314 family)